MPFPRSLVDLCIVFPDLKNVKSEEDIFRLIETWQAKSWINKDLKQENPGLLQGEFFRLQIDPPESILLYANHQGGYRVFCPKSRENIAAEFSKRVTSWRAGGKRELDCPSCQEVHGLEEVLTKPKICFSKGALILKDVSSIQISEEAKEDILRYLGEVDFVYKRVG